ncbi:MAG: ABC transporter permease, partial [Pseudomonadota bacterium]|nr:ABC transporter permease [Pseudomonadota bacterium]
MELRPILSTLRRHKTAAALIVLEIALSCAIICNALFLIGNRVERMQRASGVAVNEIVRVQLTGIGKNDNAAALTKTDLAALRALPGVKAASVANQVPFTNSSWNSSVDLQKDQAQANLNATIFLGDEQLLDTLGLNLIAGRRFNADELVDWEALDAPNSTVGIPSAIITRRVAENLYPGENAIGKTFYSWGESPIRVVGVVDHLIRPSEQGGPAAAGYSILFPVRLPFNIGGNYLIRVSDPARRAEVLKSAVEVLRRNGPNRIILEDNTRTLEALRAEYYQE